MQWLLPSLASWLVLAYSAAAAAPAWPNGPFVTSDRWMTDASGNVVTYAGVNWPGHIDVMIPEGLQYQSVPTLVSKVKSLGMNAVRLTYAIEMIDQIVANGGQDVPISKAFVDALGQENGTAVFQKVLRNNQGLFDENTTRLQVFDAVAAECAKQQIYVHLDNHVSKGAWCCTPFDGNSWWGDKYFSAANWTRGLAYMADHGKKWPNLMSMALRNELRVAFLSGGSPEPYNWDTWYKHMREGADAVHGANGDVLIFLSGLGSDTDLGPVVQRPQPGQTLVDGGAAKFNRADFRGYGDNKLVLELHYYDILRSAEPSDCAQVAGELDAEGFAAKAANRFPVLLTEFGFPQDQQTWNTTFHRCTEQFLADRRTGWTIWPLGGSYYVRQGMQDYDEGWGLLSHDWSDWRSPAHVQGGLMPLIQASRAASGGPASAATEKDQDGGGGGGGGVGGSSSGGGGNKSGAQRRSSLSSITSLCCWVAMTYGIMEFTM